MHSFRRLVFYVVSKLLGIFLAILFVGPAFVMLFIFDIEAGGWRRGISSVLAIAAPMISYTWLYFEERRGAVKFHPSKLVVLTAYHEVSLSAGFCWRLFVVDVIVLGAVTIVWMRN